MKYLRTPKTSAHLTGVNHRLTFKLPCRVRVKIAFRHWHTPAGHREMFVKFHIWQSEDTLADHG